MRAAAILVLLAGCASAPPMRVGQSCQAGTVPVEIEIGVETPCAEYARRVVFWSGLYEERWGQVALEEEGWVIRFRWDDPKPGAAGVTYHMDRIIDIQQIQAWVLPHELRHVQLGHGSDDHEGWCPEFWPWEVAAVGFDERDYLGCAR